MITDVGKVTVAVPRGRGGSCRAPRRPETLAGIDQTVISLYTRGMTTGDVAKHISEMYDTEVSKDLVSTVTD